MKKELIMFSNSIDCKKIPLNRGLFYIRKLKHFLNFINLNESNLHSELELHDSWYPFLLAFKYLKLDLI